jgi:hypothetical protein
VVKSDIFYGNCNAPVSNFIYSFRVNGKLDFFLAARRFNLYRGDMSCNDTREIHFVGTN